MSASIMVHFKPSSSCACFACFACFAGSFFTSNKLRNPVSCLEEYPQAKAGKRNNVICNKPAWTTSYSICFIWICFDIRPWNMRFSHYITSLSLQVYSTAHISPSRSTEYLRSRGWQHVMLSKIFVMFRNIDHYRYFSWIAVIAYAERTWLDSRLLHIGRAYAMCTKDNIAFD